ncbi:putative cold-shock DNA-binding protein [Anseongella ginsenosidimutans]|uniref:Putative cold-shock DNA-binding protein n=1 Tax=Anseongella ginsenosidimutans TaxID=496056 RepID=A0A4R3KQF2_9SPHI|nr:cold shock domain-containing protein [Anseongella ginsenosidimutans]QEC52605.1 cold shock domain-containing protein [Anseongella ginsenosidimutans]TCS86527.1 putative cold-shock DNA-binding protein [Anseongella ginsenosidimutans]
MGRSQESFSKKEKEKKRLKKKKEKEEKREERQANSKKGKGLDEMMAYVDEYGNILDAPPDPSQKETINSEDIEVSVSKLEKAEMNPIRKGVVTFFNDSRGYGFIRDLETQESIFVHVNETDFPIKENDRVTFEIAKGPKGANAVSVRLT